MAISIIAAFKNLFTERYNKTNILYYIIILAIACIASIYMQNEPQTMTLNMLPAYALATLIYIIGCILIGGIQAVTVNNGFKEVYNLFPSLINNFKDVLITGLKMYGGIIIIYIGLFIIFFVSALVLAIPAAIVYKFIPQEVQILLVAIIVLLFALLFFFILFIIFGLMFNFMRTLEFEDMVNVKKAFNFMKSCRNEFSTYFLKSILLGILALIIVIPIFFIVIFVISIPVVLSGHTALSSSQINSLGAMFFILYGIIMIIQIDLEIQFLLATKHIMPVIPHKDYDDSEPEYLDEDFNYPDNDDYYNDYKDNDV